MSLLNLAEPGSLRVLRFKALGQGFGVLGLSSRTAVTNPAINSKHQGVMGWSLKLERRPGLIRFYNDGLLVGNVGSNFWLQLRIL